MLQDKNAIINPKTITDVNPENSPEKLCFQVLPEGR